jgi:DNA-directed RNA polymerase I subunit RPA2
VECSIDGGHTEVVTITMGSLPIMVYSHRCHLSGLNGVGLSAAREEDSELGGYFIINGLEKVLRLIQVPMRNMPLAIKRPTYKNRGIFYTEYAVMMRCARSDQSTCTITLHYLSNGALRLRLSIRKRELMIPLALILRALQPDLSDCSIFIHTRQDGDASSLSKTSHYHCILFTDILKYPQTQV